MAISNSPIRLNICQLATTMDAPRTCTLRVENHLTQTTKCCGNLAKWVDYFGAHSYFHDDRDAGYTPERERAYQDHLSIIKLLDVIDRHNTNAIPRWDAYEQRVRNFLPFWLCAEHQQLIDEMVCCAMHQLREYFNRYRNPDGTRRDPNNAQNPTPQGPSGSALDLGGLTTAVLSDYGKDALLQIIEDLKLRADELLVRCLSLEDGNSALVAALTGVEKTSEHGSDREINHEESAPVASSSDIKNNSEDGSDREIKEEPQS